jgi:hypothetical protein
LFRGLAVPEKSERVYKFQKKTVFAAVDIMSSAGIKSPDEVNRTHIFRRVNQEQVKRYDEIFPLVKPGCFLTDNIPKCYALDLAESSARSFMPAAQLSEIDSKMHALN